MNLTPFDNPTSMDCGPFHIIMGAMPKLWNQEAEAERLLHLTSNNAVQRYLPSVVVKTKEEANQWISQMTMSWFAKTNLPIVLRLNDPIITIGYVKCFSPRHFNLNGDNADGYDGWALEYFLDKALWGKGFMSVALQNILAHLQESGANTVRASTHKDNIASSRLLKKLHFTPIGYDNEKGDHIIHQVNLNLPAA